jgi:hypothetical protein
MKSAFLGVAVLMAATSAFAGPVGEGLSHTQEVARRNAAQRTLVVLQADPVCARQAAKLIAGREGVAWAKARSEGVLIAFHSDDHATRQADQVRAVVTETCGAA